ncbi:hypothetical protein BGZ76_003898 [Entomortierella beljakovae]|nr:hypothetical protein BGZ76_003898 [Entomortierella beljakovae]
MDTKRKSTLGRAFALFKSKSSSQTQPQPTDTSPANQDNNSSEITAPSKHVVIDTNPTNLQGGKSTPSHDANEISDSCVNNMDSKTELSDQPISPGIHSPEVAYISSPESTGPSQFASSTHNTNDSQHNTNKISPPGSPVFSSTHFRENTGMTNQSSSTFQGLSSSEDGGPEGGINPADILLNRLAAYRLVVKNLQLYFTDIAQVEGSISKAMQKSSNMIVVPFKDGSQFLGKGGLQDVCTGVRESTKTRGDQHAAEARFVEETIVKRIRRLKQDIKGRIKSLKSDTDLYESKVFKEREATQELIGTLAKAVGLFENIGGHQSDMENAQSDPYLINISLRRQLAKQVSEENLFARALQQCQEQIMMFEKHIINEVKQVLGSFAKYQMEHAGTGFTQSWAPTDLALNVLQEDTEWTNFLERNGHLLFPSELVDSDPDELDYPCKSSPFLIPVKTAHLSRQSSVLKNWKSGYFVITLSGWLHVFESADLLKDSVPERSIYIPTATLGPNSDNGHKQHVFSLDGKGMAGILHREAQKFTLRANSREEMLSWWEEISKRAHSTMFVQHGGGHSEASLSRTGSLMRSSTVRRSGSRPQTPVSSRLEVPLNSNNKETRSMPENGEHAVASSTDISHTSESTQVNTTVASHAEEPVVQPIFQQPSQPISQQPSQPISQQPSQPISQQPSQPLPIKRNNSGSTVSLNTEMLSLVIVILNIFGVLTL